MKMVLVMVALACNFNIQHTETGRSEVQDQPGIHCKSGAHWIHKILLQQYIHVYIDLCR